ncbi:MAG: hypothetical protein U0992_18645 [Planctomycetaceae bacterium]
MSRRRDRSRSTAMPAGVTMRLGSAIVALLILGMIYSRARDPRTWRWLAPEDGAPPVAAIPAQAGQGAPPVTPPVAPVEVVVPGPTDLDEADSQEVQTQFSALGDKSALAKEDMPAYWRVMRWTRAQTFDELLARADQNVLYTQFLTGDPNNQRGKPFRLRLHIAMIVELTGKDVPENSAGVDKLYEVWGRTDDSSTFLYSIICPELPPGMRIGKDIHEEGVFVGYFLKVMPYQAAVKGLAAPIMIGRLRAVPRPPAPPAPQLPPWVWITGAVGLLAAAAWGWRQFAHAPPRRKVQTAGVGEEDAVDWFGQPNDDRTASQSSPDDHPSP